VEITRSSIENHAGPSDWFNRNRSTVDALAVPAGPSTVQAASVHFTPGARTAWHSHPLGQTIFVTEGVGRCQRRGGPVEAIRPGDRRVSSRRGALARRGHRTASWCIWAIQQVDGSGSLATWGEHVSDEEYAIEPASDRAGAARCASRPRSRRLPYDALISCSRCRSRAAASLPLPLPRGMPDRHVRSVRPLESATLRASPQPRPPRPPRPCSVIQQTEYDQRNVSPRVVLGGSLCGSTFEGPHPVALPLAIRGGCHTLERSSHAAGPR